MFFFSFIFTKGNNICSFLFAALDDEKPFKMGFTL